MENEATFIILKELAGNPPPKLNAIQAFLAPHTNLLADVWVAAWVMTSLVVLWRLWYEYQAHRKGGRT
jgi:hypothetical protein